MPAHEKTYDRLTASLKATLDPAQRDALLDEWVDIRDRATEYDADQWGLNPDDPMWGSLTNENA